jgi:predicted TIM-barrel fold metal-dependent hydrolase
MRVIDSHVHLYPPETNQNPAAWAEAAGEHAWAKMSLRRRRNGSPVQSFPSVDDLLREMDRCGVERCVLLGWYWLRAETCAQQNRFFAECVRQHGDRLSAFATLQPAAGREVALAELGRARGEGLEGVGELSPHSQGYRIDDPVFGEVLRVCGEWSLPVNLHVTDPNSREYPGRVETPLEDFLTLAREFPRANFILAHWGGLLPLRETTAAELANLYYDTAASPLLYDDTVWRRFLAVVRHDRVLFGSDFPLNLYPRTEVTAGMARFVAEAKNAEAPDAVMRGNAARLLRL